MIHMAACKALCKLLWHCCALPLSTCKVKSVCPVETQSSLPFAMNEGLWDCSRWSSGDGGGVVLLSCGLSSAWWLGAFSLSDSPFSQHSWDQQRQYVGHKYSPLHGALGRPGSWLHPGPAETPDPSSQGWCGTEGPRAPCAALLAYSNPSELWCLAVHGQSDLIVPRLGSISTDKTNTPA